MKMLKVAKMLTVFQNTKEDCLDPSVSGFLRWSKDPDSILEHVSEIGFIVTFRTRE